MLKTIVCLALLVSSLSFAAEQPPAVAPATTPASVIGSQSVNSLSIEGLGVGALYSVFYSRRLGDFALSAGYSSWSFTLFTTTRFTLIPVSVSYLIGGKNSFFEVTGGAVPTFASSSDGTIDLDDAGSLPITGSSSSVVFGFAGIGYRYWPWDGGFHFRATLYGLIGGGGVYPWPGLSFGYAF